jgi:hypothetical protein
MEGPTAKTSSERPFCYFVYPSAVKVAETVPCIYHSQVKPASLEWESIPDPASPRKITFWNFHTLPWQDSAPLETTEDHGRWDNSPALVTPEAD